jgi:hypothetical protein
MSLYEISFFEPAGSLGPAAPKEKMMKRNLSLWLCLSAAAGLVSFALLPALAQLPPPSVPTGKVHGHVTNPSGAPQAGGTVSFSSVDRASSGPGIAATTSDKGSFPVDASGDYSGQLPPGTYVAIYRSPGMMSDQQADHAEGVKISVGQDTLQDIDMSRKAYIDALPADQQKQLEELRKHNSEALKANEVIKRPQRRPESHDPGHQGCRQRARNGSSNPWRNASKSDHRCEGN